MRLYIIRHAIAVPVTEASSDAARPLTDKGKRRWQRAVVGLTRLGVRVDRVYHSPWLRAVQTANELHALVKAETRVTELLAQAPSPRLLEALEGDDVALVGHEPWLGELCAWLLTGNPEHAPRFEFKKGAVAILEGPLQPGEMTLLSLLPPKLLRSVKS
jgi:phosphohistidine phosphatase